MNFWETKHLTQLRPALGKKHLRRCRLQGGFQAFSRLSELLLTNGVRRVLLQRCSSFMVPGVSKGCLEVFKYLRASKKHSFVTPGMGIFTLTYKQISKDSKRRNMVSPNPFNPEAILIMKHQEAHETVPGRPGRPPLASNVVPLARPCSHSAAFAPSAVGWCFGGVGSFRPSAACLEGS